MNSGLKTPKVTVNIETLAYFSASIAAMKVSPVTRVSVVMPGAVTTGKLSVSVVGKVGNREFLKRCDFEKENFSVDNFNLKNNTTVEFCFDFDCFNFDYALLGSIEEDTTAEIYVLVNFGGNEYMSKSSLTLIPKDTWIGLESDPVVLSQFVKFEDQSIEKICSEAWEKGRINYYTDSKKTIIEALKQLYKRLKTCNIIYSRPAGYSAGTKQRIRTPDKLFSSSSILATPLEIALCFCACAKRMGFDTSITFVRGKKGDIFVLCGVYLVKSPVNVPVCEDAVKIANMVDGGDMLIIDPSVFAAAQNTSFVMTLETTAENFISSSSGLVCHIDVNNALESAELDKSFDEFENVSTKNAVALLYSGLASSPVMQVLAGKNRREIEDIPLLLPNFGKVFTDENTTYKLLPLDLGVSLDDFAPIDKHFSSIVTMNSTRTKQHFSQGELSRLETRFENLKEKIDRDDEITTALRDEELYKVSSEMAFGKNKKEPYFAFGYVKIKDKLTEIVSYAPICLVKAEFNYDNGNFYVKQAGKPIVNKVFIRNALKDSGLGYDSFMKSLMPTDKKEIFDMFENIRMALSETDDRHVYELIKEAHVINIEIDDYILWTNLALSRKKISENQIVENVFEKVKTEEKINKGYVPAMPLYSAEAKAVCNETSSVVEGIFTENKENVLVSMALKNVTSGKSTLIVTDDEEMSEYVGRVFEKHELSDMCYVLNNTRHSHDAAKKIENQIEKYKDCQMANSPAISKDLTDADSLLVDYTSRLARRGKTGMSLKEAVKAYLSAGIGTENLDNIHVDKSVFKNANEARVDEIFSLAGALITGARNLCKNSGLEKHSPIKSHPLYFTRPGKELTEAEKAAVEVAIDTSIPVLSEYRDTFMEVGEILGISERDITTLGKLEKVNELMKLVLSSKDLDIPEKFIESDIASFTQNKRFANETRKRMQAIEFKLGFFNEEIFEDIENLISGYEYENEEDAGFIKKLMTKKNSQDKLLQYVENDKKSLFSQHKVKDIYKLLYEYKSLVISLRERGNEKQEAEQTSKLAHVSDVASQLIDEINPSEASHKKILANVFRLISVIPVDGALARKITVSRARLSELYSGEECVFSVITRHMGVRFDDIYFEDGVLSFDGLGKYLNQMKSKLEITGIWNNWLEMTASANEVFPGFVKYLEEHGAGSNVDRLFAKSLLYPITLIACDDALSGLSNENLGKAKDKYVNLLEHACFVSKNNAWQSYKNVMNHVAKTYGIDADKYKSVDFQEFVREKLIVLQKVMPVLVITKNDLTEALPMDVCFDSVFVIDNANNGYSMLPALSFGNSACIFNMSKIERSALATEFAKSYPVFDVCTFTDKHSEAALGLVLEEWFEKDIYCVNTTLSNNIELVRMNGTYDRTTTRTNKTETELAMVKATSLLQNDTSRVAITAFTKEQCTAMEKLMHLLCKKNKTLAKAKDEKRVFICTPDRLYMKNYDSLVVSACFGTDKDSRLGWDFGYGSVKKTGVLPEGYLCMLDKGTEKTYLLSSLNVKDSRLIRRTGANAYLFNDICEFLSDGRIPVNMRKLLSNHDDGVLEEVLAYVDKTNKGTVLCEGKRVMQFALKTGKENSVYALVDNERGISMHDLLLAKRKLENKNVSALTLPINKFLGRECRETIANLLGNSETIN